MTFTAGEILTASKLNSEIGLSTNAGDIQNTVGTTTSTTFTATLTGGTAVGVAFVAPASGAVIFHYNSLMTNSGANFSYSSPQVRTGGTVGSGTIVLAVIDDYALTHQGTNQDRYGGTKRLTGLSPGVTYNVQMLHRASAGTGTFSRKELIVTPG